jgi:undecaprenyl diphosphate synthase
MDGNGRYALKSGMLARYFGHSKGVDALRRVIARAYDLKVQNLTVFAFSTENWSREEKEINEIFKLLEKFLDNYEKELNGRSIRLRAIGNTTKLPDTIQAKLAAVTDATKNNDKMNFYVALNYGGRDEILRAFDRAKEENIESESDLNKYMDAPEIDDIDLVIRTSGEKRMSNFLLWQTAYAELYFTKKLWPAFTAKDFDKAILDFQKRTRRRGR